MLDVEGPYAMPIGIDKVPGIVLLCLVTKPRHTLPPMLFIGTQELDK